MLFGALGDIHGDFDSVRRVLARHPDIPFWLCVGDVGDDRGIYEAVDAPIYWIKGNNESFDRVASADLPAGLHHIPNGTLQTIGDLRVAGLGGTFAPTWYETLASDLPHPKKRTAKASILSDTRRHFVREEVEACKRMTGVDERHSVAVDASISLPAGEFRQLRVGGTPTLVLANRDGVVRKIWVGQLPERAEQEVLELVSGRIAVQ